MRVLVAGWFSFSDGEATAGDLLAAEPVCRMLRAAGVDFDVAWSPVFRPGALSLGEAVPDRYTHLLFVCGPVAGGPVAALHERFAGCRRIAVGVSVIDPADPAAAGFHTVLARDGLGLPPCRDLSAGAVAAERTAAVPVTGVALTEGQGEYGQRRRHEQVLQRLTSWLGTKQCAPVVLETRLDSRDWRLCSGPEAFSALLRKLDLVVTMRLHGLALALAAGIPALAVDPVDGGGKVTAQAAAWDWPAVVTAESADPAVLDRHWDWCLSAAGRERAARAAAQADGEQQPMLAALAGLLAADQAASAGQAAATAWGTAGR
jgi:Polysaccharide pyruvyl transferase